MKKYVAAAVLLSIALTAGCSGNTSSQSESPSKPENPTSEATTTTSAAQPEPTTEIAESEETEPAYEQTNVSTTAQTEPPAETTAPENPGGYIADWIYGTWSAVSVNGQEYWDYAFANGLTEQAQLVFESDGNVRAVGGEVGVEQEYTYQITDEGADIYYSFGEKNCSLVYAPATDMMTVYFEAPDGGTVVLKRGEYPQPEAGLDYIADWIYGTWSVISVDGVEFWTWAAQNDIDDEYQMNFTAQNAEIIIGGEVRLTVSYRITDDGAELRAEDGTIIPMTYSPADDTLSFTMDGNSGVMKRGTNPKPSEN